MAKYCHPLRWMAVFHNASNSGCRLSYCGAWTTNQPFFHGLHKICGS